MQNYVTYKLSKLGWEGAEKSKAITKKKKGKVKYFLENTHCIEREPGREKVGGVNIDNLLERRKRQCQIHLHPGTGMKRKIAEGLSSLFLKLIA